jgi:tetratricopeptide (TPR) repeat protein
VSAAWKLDGRLREEALDPAAFAAEVERRLEELITARSQPARLLAMLIEAAPLLRIAGRLEESRKTAAAAIALAELVEDPIATFRARVALAQAMQREGRFEIATPLFDQLIVQARSSPQLNSFLHEVLFHAGQSLFDQGRMAEAGRCFRESHALRREGGMGDLIEVAAEAVRLAREAA